MPPLTREQTVINLGLAGSACAAAQTCVHPSETSMVRQQLSTKSQRLTFVGTLFNIARGEGFRGLYRGIEAAMLREMSYSTLRFGLYEPLRDLMNDNPAANTAVAGPEWQATVRVAKRAFAGCAAGGIASAIASPTDLLKIRAQSDTKLPVPGMMHYVRAVAARPGGPIKPFYEGVSATISRAVVLGATKMVTYNEVKDALKRSPGHRDPTKRPSEWQRALPFTYGWRDSDWQSYGHDAPPSVPARLFLVFQTSVAAGLAITITTSPITNTRTHMMANPGKFKGFGSALYYVGEKYGPRGYFRGFAAQWARFGPYAVVQFLVWEQLRLVCGLPGI